MQPFWTSNNGDTKLTIYHGDALDVLRQLPDGSVHCCITSPPYWGLRDYGVDGQIGLESSPEEYVERLVRVFREVRRVLRADGTLWLNLGDCYASPGKGGPWDAGRKQKNTGRLLYAQQANRGNLPPNLKPKDLVGIPWMVAFALRDDGWYLRADIVWAKPNPMPESVTDRPTKAHEYMFLLAKNPRYYYDADAIREPAAACNWHDWTGPGYSAPGQPPQSGNRARKPNHQGGRAHFATGIPWSGWTRNKRSVWWVPIEPYAEAHFAVYPTALVEPCILAGTSPQACPKCGAPWERVLGREKHPTWDVEAQRMAAAARTGRTDGHVPGPSGMLDRVFTLGWRPTCSCPDNDGSGRCVVLDPFVGSGTTLLVAQRLGRSGIGIDLNRDYCDMARRRLEAEHMQMRLPVVS